MDTFERLSMLPLAYREPETVLIGKASVASHHRSLIVAEIGTSHGGSIETAAKLIDKAAEAGADCAKFQVVFAHEIVHPKTGNVQLPGGPTPLYEVFKSIERNADFYDQLKQKTESAGLIFLCTPFGLESAGVLKRIGVDAVKVASPEINHIPLLEEVASWDVPVVLSTGISTLADVEYALSLLPVQTVVLHCVTNYPAPEVESNLLCVPVLSASFGKLTGISDHSLEPALVPALSTVLGGCMIEKHFTLHRESGGLDDPVALTPCQFKEMSDTVRAIEAMSPADGMSYLMERYTEKRVKGALGDGVKKPSTSELDYYRSTNRSIMAVRNIQKGEPIEAEAVALLRSEQNLKPGLSPRMLPLVVGRIAQRDIHTGAGIDWDDLMSARQ